MFRRGWRTDLAHFFASHLLLQVTSLLTVAPALLLFRAVSVPALGALQEGVAVPEGWLAQLVWPLRGPRA